MAHTDIHRLIGEARNNEIKHRRFQAMELRLMEAESLPQVCGLLVDDYRAAFQLDAVALHLFDPERELMRLENSRELSRLQCVYLHHAAQNRLELLCGARPRLGAYDPTSHRDLFPARRGGLGSLAILPLRRRQRAIGLIALGSLNDKRFVSADGTEFLQRLAAVAGVCIDNALNLERLRQAGLRDPLTRLYNRRHFDDCLRREIHVAQRQQRPLSCLYMDVDHFKRINDGFGHPVGDLVLQGVADALRSQQRMSEVLARLGGEEFALLLPGTELAAASAAGERIRLRIAQSRFETGEGESIRATLSCGVATVCPGPEADLSAMAELLLVEADKALLRAKSAGRNQVCAAPARARVTQ